MFMIRQGDVLVRQVDAIPAGAKKVAKDKGRVILAYGEVTGHVHAIWNRAVMFRDDGLGQTFLRVEEGGTTVVHEEHAPVDLPAGNYEVVIQREYTPEGLRNVAD